MKVTCRCGFGSHMFVLYWYLQVFMFFSLPASISLKPSFYICSPGSFQVTWSFQYLSQLFGQVGMVNCFATRSPKHMTLAFQQCHLQVCLWREETEAMPHSRLWLCHQRSTHCVPATTTPGFFLDLTFSANSFLLCETCFFLTCGECWECHFGQLFALSEWSWVLQPLLKCVCRLVALKSANFLLQDCQEDEEQQKRSSKSVLEVPRTCWKRSIKKDMLKG